MFNSKGFIFCELCDQTVGSVSCSECGEACENCHSEYGCE